MKPFKECKNKNHKFGLPMPPKTRNLGKTVLNSLTYLFFTKIYSMIKTGLVYNLT